MQSSITSVDLIAIIIVLLYLMVDVNLQLANLTRHFITVVLILVILYFSAVRQSHVVVIACLSFGLLHFVFPSFFSLSNLIPAKSNLPPFLQQLNREGPQTMADQFPYTLEQEVVSKMAPILTTSNGASMFGQTYSPSMSDAHDAVQVSDPPATLVAFH